MFCVLRRPPDDSTSSRAAMALDVMLDNERNVDGCHVCREVEVGSSSFDVLFTYAGFNGHSASSSSGLTMTPYLRSISLSMFPLGM